MNKRAASNRINCFNILSHFLNLKTAFKFMKIFILWISLSFEIYGLSWRFFKQTKLVFSYQNGNLINNSLATIYDLALDLTF